MSQTLMVADIDSPEQIQSWLLATDKLKNSLEKHRYLRPDFLGDGAGALITTRCGGESCSPYDSFNLGHHVGDNPEQVQRNREILFEDIGCRHLCFMHQTHSNKVLCVSTQKIDTPFTTDMVQVNEPIVQGLDCDGLVTAEQGIALAVMTADCLPVLLYEPHAQVVAAVHCGWKGILYNILDQALIQMAHLGAQVGKVRAFVGPGIAQGSFEVGADLKQTFVSENAAYEQFFAQEGRVSDQGQLTCVKDKFLCDLHGICRSALLKAGVASEYIKVGHFDTYQQPELFYSYRRHKQTGRMGSVIWLK